ncbi:MAG: 3-isopropylmalate dehydrogenase [Chloroflexota bacterium]|nr:3-isopropylmalate dehydrogenase [Chloroflexota bacterium]
MATFDLLVLPGDGIGVEVTSAAQRVLDTVGRRFKHTFRSASAAVGGVSIDNPGAPPRAETTALARKADAVLFGAVGGPKWDDAPVRPEAAILGLRKALGLFANIRPVKIFPGMEEASPVKNDRVNGVDLIIIRELTGGLYYGKPKRRWTTKAGRQGVDAMRYSEREVDRIMRTAFELARTRSRRVTSVDKANVLEVSRMWREVANDVAKDYPDVTLEHQLVDSCAMLLVTRPASFDVLVMGNMFGDILSDEAAVITGSLGMLPSASLAGLPRSGGGRRRAVRGLYEPIHGTAPDIAGQSKANPLGAILSAAFMLQYSFGLAEEAHVVNAAVEGALAEGLRTADLAPAGARAVSTEQMTDAVAAGVEAA